MNKVFCIIFFVLVYTIARQRLLLYSRFLSLFVYKKKIEVSFEFFINVINPDCMSWQVDEMYREAPIKKSMFDYVEFTRILKHGAKDPEDV